MLHSMYHKGAMRHHHTLVRMAKYQTLAQAWGNRISHSWLKGMQNDAAILENSC